MRMNLFKLPAVMTLCVIWAVLPACQSKGEPRTGDASPTQIEANDNQPGRGAAGNAWQPVPITMRIYPSTRFLRDQQEAILETRIELFDEMGDSMKASGQYHFELYAGNLERGSAVGRRLYTWDVEVSTLEHQQYYYDPITRTYLFRLTMDNLAPARDLTSLVVHFTRTDGTRLNVTQIMRQKRVEE